MPDAMTTDFDLLEGALADAIAEADGIRHNQRDWILAAAPFADADTDCGTALCLAGRIAVRVGAELPHPEHHPHWGWTYPQWRVNPATGRFDPGGMLVADFARDRVGLTDGQAEALFASWNTLHDLRAMVAYLRQHPHAAEHELEALRDADRD